MAETKVKSPDQIRSELLQYLRKEFAGKIWVSKGLEDLVRQAHAAAPGDPSIDLVYQVFQIVSRKGEDKPKKVYF